MVIRWWGLEVGKVVYFGYPVNRLFAIHVIELLSLSVFFCKALKNGCHFSACNIFDMFFPVIGNEFHVPLASCTPGFSRSTSFVGIKT